MKFNDGFWLLKNGVKAYYGLEVTQITPLNEGFQLQVATRFIQQRGDTLGGPLLTVKVHSPTAGIIGVKIEHFYSEESTPNIPLFPDAKSDVSQISLNRETTSLSSGGLTAEIASKPYSITFKSDKRILTQQGIKHQAIYDVPAIWTASSASNSSCLNLDQNSNPNRTRLLEGDMVRYINSELNLSPGELVYGFGEQFGGFVKNGQSIKIWNQDGGTSSDQAYKCVPFYMTNRNYGVFINNPGEVEVEVGAEKVSRVGFSIAGESLEYFIIYGETPLEILEKYTRMTGRPALVPAWTFGLWLSTSFTTDYSSKTVSGFLEGMRQRNCPVRVFHLDCFWMKQYEWCSFTFDPENFPDPQAYLAGIKNEYGVKICLWINPYISQHSPIFLEAAQKGYFIKRTNGKVWSWDLWQPGLAVVDITNPDACEWYASKLRALLDLGVDAFKTDFGERIPHADIVYHDGSDPKKMHNTYSVQYNELVFNVLKARFGENEAVVFARSSAAGGQRYPVHWGGDCESTFEAMAETLRGGLSLTLSGFAYNSHDIGGFEGHPPPEIYQRWVAFGLFSSHSRLHGSSSYRVPWQYGEDAAKSMAKFVDTKHQLMPYLYNLAIQANTVGHPLQRPMFFEFLADRNTHTLDRQYMLGPSILVAPVFVPAAEESEYYIPEGRWTNLFHPERVVTGPYWVNEVVPIDEIPVFVRPGTVLLTGPSGIGKPDYGYAETGLVVRLYEIAQGAIVQTEVPAGKGNVIAGKITVTRNQDELKVAVTTGSVSFSVVNVFSSDIGKPSAVVGGTIEKALSGVGLHIVVSKGATEVFIKY